MPRNSMAAKRYAQALFSVTDDKAATLQELSVFVEGVQKAPGAEALFSSPIVSRDDKKAILADLKEKLPHTNRFLAALIDEDRMDCLKEIVEKFRQACEDLSGEMSVEVQTARPPSKEMLEDIKNVLQDKWGRQIKISATVHPDILGGFIAKAPGRIMDASVASQIQALEQQVLGG